MYVQRYIPHPPAAGEIVIFDRSWYNRAGVESVMGFCTEETRSSAFLEAVPNVEKAIIDPGRDPAQVLARGESRGAEQTSRSPHHDGRKTWKLSDKDLKSYTRWDDYTKARDDMFLATDTAWAPWYLARSDDKASRRLNIIEHLLGNIPYKSARRTRR